MRLAALLLEYKLKHARLTLLLEHDLIERFDRDRREHLRSEIAGVESCAERQDLRAAIARCRDSEADDVGEMLDSEFRRHQHARRFDHLHLGNG